MFSIKTTNVSKKYCLYARPGDRIREALFLGRKMLHQEFWALKNIYLEVPKGCTLGVIGPNGAGKTTLLKILTGITHPTSGEVTLNGQVSGILSLGAGFHLEFSGKENILMNCSILGFSREETQAKMDAIIAFSELGDFIDHPVKTYSSGMTLRLGFSVAINIDLDILVIDEVLAVGDEHFRGKCFKKINELREKGKTIIFVSHDLSTVRTFCDQVIFINEGRIVAQGKAEDVADTYLSWVHSHSFEKMKILNQAAKEAPPRWGTGEMEIKEIKLFNKNGEESYSFYPGDPMEIRASFLVKKDTAKAVFGFNIYRNDGTLCVNNNHVANEVLDDRSWNLEEALQKIRPRKAGEEGVVSFYFKHLPLVQGIYRLNFFIYDVGKSLPRPIDEIEGVKTFQVEKDGIGRTGVFFCQGEWEFRKLSM